MGVAKRDRPDPCAISFRGNREATVGMDVSHGEFDENDPLAPRFGDKRASFVATSRTKMNPVGDARRKNDLRAERTRAPTPTDRIRTRRLTTSSDRSQGRCSASIER